jgi:hypothetical protein
MILRQSLGAEELNIRRIACLLRVSQNPQATRRGPGFSGRCCRPGRHPTGTVTDDSDSDHDQ